ncbi:MAG: glycerate kinase [Sedimentisphaerales bacterium]|nr:glycerate kinase [Sedimentisphaerales bacterium]
MKIVVAMDSFKGSLTSVEACEIVADAIGCSVDAEIIIKPMADGGEGTAEAMLRSGGGVWIEKRVMGPLPDMEVEAGFAWFEETKTALVEMAKASGLELLERGQGDPLATTTYGTGQLIKAAVEHGAERIQLAVGGSATVDGGTGAAAALGWRFLDSHGNPVCPGGAGLIDIADIVGPAELELPAVEVLCDVDNPLCGEDGAARVFGPQKGADSAAVSLLEAGLLHLADLAARQLGCEIADTAGGGAAGGLAAGATAFMGGSLVSGIETVMAGADLAGEAASADWVVTGEGCFDEQSLRGKVVSGVLALARERGVRAAVLAGQVMVSAGDCEKLGVAAAIACREEGMSLDYALKHCRRLLGDRAKRLACEYMLR